MTPDEIAVARAHYQADIITDGIPTIRRPGTPSRRRRSTPPPKPWQLREGERVLSDLSAAALERLLQGERPVDVSIRTGYSESAIGMSLMRTRKRFKANSLTHLVYILTTLGYIDASLTVHKRV